MPHSSRPGEELPPTFRNVTVGMAGLRGREFVEHAEVQYKVVAVWENNDQIDQARYVLPFDGKLNMHQLTYYIFQA